jgi:hypothetical protein
VVAIEDLDLEPYGQTDGQCPVCGGPVEAEHGYLTDDANEIPVAMNARCSLPSCLANDPEVYASLVGDEDDA